ncbi:sugar ABC transporter ATP-binding protein [Marispirochaeta sp.]|jgi:inositol transport system ATP-binding protein|uniref:sugar ABC transporter ATP-binding protein n=1 Tax=Marispirochaeta sp. TaxID=2038653 RepID=UPI0029C6AB28|nr:sugar ABC transporter ATP-binding protein [Marispirochaeta sp.]
MEGIKLRVSGIEKSFPGVKALSNINFSVRTGTVHVLCGENGAGKSTLMKIINGVYKQDRGSIFIDEKPVTINNPTQAREHGISMIFQELNYIPELTVEESLFVGRLPVNRWGKVDWKKIRAETGRLLHEEGLQYSPTTRMKDLSVSDVQMLEIVKAISCKSEIIIMDEPTSAITQKEVEFLFKKIEKLKKNGTSIIYISHKMDEIFRIADEITVLRDGSVVDTRSRDNITIDEVITLMVGRELSKEFPKDQVEAGEPVFEVQGLTREGYFENVSFSVRRREIVGFAGLMGAGRTEVMRAIFGLDPYSAGTIYKDGKEVKSRSVHGCIDNGVVMLSEDRRRYGIIPIRGVRENVTLANLKKFFYKGRLHARKEVMFVKNICDQMNVKTPSYETTVDSLSGGNQQKVVLAKWMINDPDVLIMDEPTRGIDVGAKYEIYKLMNSFVGSDKAIIIVSSELPELLGMCDRIYVMSKGRIAGVLERKDFSQEAVMKMATGLRMEEAVNEN